MSQRSLRTTSLIGLSSILIAGGLVAAACGSDRSPNTGDGQLTPDPSNGEPGTGGTSSDPGAPDPMNGSAGTSNDVDMSGNEGQGGSVPIDDGNPEQPGGPGAGGSGSMEPPPGPTGLAPNCNPPEGNVPPLTLELVANGLTQPLYVTSAPGDDSRLFIVEKGGTVRVLVNGELQQTPFITVAVPTGPQAFERGLLGMAFHPNYAANGLFYLHYSSNGGAGLPANGDTVIAEYRVSDDRSIADAASRRVVLTVSQPAANHNGGEITFSADGMLYIGLGDGGGGGDQFGTIGNGQNLNTRLGKILRIDPLGRDVGNAFSVPPGNLPEVTGQQALPEIWAYGLRNPWRFSFDACTGDLYIGDVGQDDVEEIDFSPASTETRLVSAGANFGWRIMEGSICRPGEANCNAQTQAGLTLPIDTYLHEVGTSVTGGYVYRGSNVPGLRGHYIYADYNSARFFRFRVQNGQLAERTEITNEMRPAGGGNIDNIASFGTDNAGEMYVAAFTPGAVYRVAAAE